MTTVQSEPMTPQAAMTLAAIAATAATTRPSGEQVSQQCNRAFLGLNQLLPDSSLATRGTWILNWIAMSPANANMAYLAQNRDGSNQFAVVLRGTVGTVTDLLEDLDVGTVVPFGFAGSSSDPASVSKGAMTAFSQVLTMNSVGVTLAQALAGVLAKAPANPTVYVIGHSLGGCLATMVGAYLQAQSWPGNPQFGLYTFAAPSAGNAAFANHLTEELSWVVNQRYVNCWDIVPLAWTSLDEAKKWYPDKGPKANEDVRAVISALAGLPGPNVYAQPGPAVPLNQHYVPDPALVKGSLQDFMGQVAYQHANDTYLGLLGAPDVPSGPVVTGIGPDTGGTGNQVTVTGTGFNAGQGVALDFGTVACPRIAVSTDGTTITTYPPAGAGVVPVRVTTFLGTSPAVATAQFAYEGAAPVRVTAISQDHGRTGTPVTVTGVNFGSDAKVFFGDNQAVGQVTPPDTIAATAPAPTKGVGKPKTVDITVLSNGWSSPASPADEFAYEELEGPERG
ncbi:IPT/TIG domain-containing protein [Kitasatospora sp. NPDC001547]|uniref:lipase family protein n=1 Tax=Kitasatospora sp. NPDC001547 TaxID=3364015 RepID=UPI0036BD1B39